MCEEYNIIFKKISMNLLYDIKLQYIMKIIVL